jgi:RNase P protein component
MQGKALVKAYIPFGLEKSLKEECDRCGCSVSAVVGNAIVREVTRRRMERRNEARLLEGQQELIKKA